MRKIALILPLIAMMGLILVPAAAGAESRTTEFTRA
jgi:hypothetical protein